MPPDSKLKALEVSINGKIVRVCLPPKDGFFGLTVANLPGSHMRGAVIATNDVVDYRWHLPHVGERDVLSVRMIPAKDGDEPDVISTVHDANQDEQKETRRLTTVSARREDRDD